jgi:hypothetical protein
MTVLPFVDQFREISLEMIRVTVFKMFPWFCTVCQCMTRLLAIRAVGVSKKTLSRMLFPTSLPRVYFSGIVSSDKFLVVVVLSPRRTIMIPLSFLIIILLINHPCRYHSSRLNSILIRLWVTRPYYCPDLWIYSPDKLANSD